MALCLGPCPARKVAAGLGDWAIGAAIRRAGLSSDEAVAMLTQGEWDPFADVQMPDQPSRDNNPTDGLFSFIGGWKARRLPGPPSVGSPVRPPRDRLEDGPKPGREICR